MGREEQYRGFTIVNKCGLYYLRWNGSETGPFSSAPDVRTHIDTLHPTTKHGDSEEPLQGAGTRISDPLSDTRH